MNNRVRLTSFQRCFEILSTPVIGSMKTSFATRVSGIHIAHRRCTHSPVTVCLKAPPSFGQRSQFWQTTVKMFLTEMILRHSPQGFLAIPCIFYKAIDPPGYMEHRSNLIRPSQATEDGTKGKAAYPDAPPDCTHHKTRLRCCFLLRNHRIWHRSNLQRAWQSLALGYSWSTPRCLSSVGEIEGPWLYLHTKSNHSFSKRSMMISKLSQVTLSFPPFVRSLLTTSSHS